VAAKQERERQWRVARGEEAPGPGPAGGPQLRETWMTELPPEKRAVALQPSQVSQTAFSRTAIRGRGDTREWTDTPEARAARHMQVRAAGDSGVGGRARQAAPHRQLAVLLGTLGPCRHRSVALASLGRGWRAPRARPALEACQQASAQALLRLQRWRPAGSLSPRAPRPAAADALACPLPQSCATLQAMLEGPSTGPLQLESPKLSAEAAAMQSLLASQRPKSLLEQHLEKQQQQAKEQAKGSKPSSKDHKERKPSKDRSKDKDWGEKRKADEWAAAHPWRPFDRDKDMLQSGSAKSAAQLLKDNDALKSRFGGGGASSSFL
jgi:hypothetical protein